MLGEETAFFWVCLSVLVKGACGDPKCCLVHPHSETLCGNRGPILMWTWSKLHFGSKSSLGCFHFFLLWLEGGFSQSTAVVLILCRPTTSGQSAEQIWNFNRKEIHNLTPVMMKSPMLLCWIGTMHCYPAVFGVWSACQTCLFSLLITNLCKYCFVIVFC